MTCANSREELLIKYIPFNISSIVLKTTIISTLIYIFSILFDVYGTVLQNWVVMTKIDISLNYLCNKMIETNTFTRYETGYSKEAVPLPLKIKALLIRCWHHDVIWYNHFWVNGVLLSWSILQMLKLSVSPYTL